MVVDYCRRVVRGGGAKSAVEVYNIILFINVDDFESDPSLSLEAVLVRCCDNFAIIPGFS